MIELIEREETIKALVDEAKIIDGKRFEEPNLQHVFDFGGIIRSMPTVQAVPIPDNATNGDVIRAVFPNIITDEFASTIHATTKVVSNGVKGGISYDFWKDWWNSPYKRGDVE